MPRALLLVTTNVTDPAADTEFNRWYDTVHLNDVLTTPGILRATRFELAGGPQEGLGKYLALYEIEADDPDAVLVRLGEVLAAKQAEGHVIAHPALTLVSRGLYVQRGDPQPVE